MQIVKVFKANTTKVTFDAKAIVKELKKQQKDNIFVAEKVLEEQVKMKILRKLHHVANGKRHYVSLPLRTSEITHDKSAEIIGYGKFAGVNVKKVYRKVAKDLKKQGIQCEVTMKYADKKDKNDYSLVALEIIGFD